MCKLFDEWSQNIRQYCEENNLSFDKAKKLSQCWGENMLALQYHDPEKGKLGLKDETPMPVVLIVHRTSDGTIIIEPTEHTHHYLAEES